MGNEKSKEGSGGAGSGGGKKGASKSKKQVSLPAGLPEIENNREYKLVVLGAGGVGKTALSIQFMNGKFVVDYDPTIEDAYKKEYVVNDRGVEKSIVVSIIDTAGQEEYSSGLHEKFIRQGEGFLCVYSITSPASLEKIKEIHEQIAFTKEVEHPPIVIVGNKSDLEKERKVTREQGEALAKQFDCPFMETSAKTAENVTNAIETLLLEIAKKSAK